MTCKEIFVELKYVYFENTNKMTHNTVWLICFGVTLPILQKTISSK